MNWFSVSWRSFFEMAELGRLQWIHQPSGATVACFASPAEAIEHLIVPNDYIAPSVNDSNTHIGPARGRWSMAFHWMPL
jgi:hypothetical protein